MLEKNNIRSCKCNSAAVFAEDGKVKSDTVSTFEAETEESEVTENPVWSHLRNYLNCIKMFLTDAEQLPLQLSSSLST